MLHPARVTLLGLVAALAVPTSPAAAQRGQATLVTTPVLARQRVEGGVTIFEHDRDAFTRATRLTLDASVVTVVGGADGDPAYDLTGAHQVVLLSDGRLATFATVGNKFLIFGADGRGQRTLGRTGQGPGEFMAVGNMIGLTGDTLFLPDPGNNRLNWVLADRGVVASRPRDGGSRSHFENAAGALPGGRLVMHSSGVLQSEVRDGNTRPPASVVVLPPSGPAREIAKIPDFELAMVETRYRGRPRIVATPMRFSRSAHVVVWDTLIATAVGDGYRVDLWTAEGRIVSRLAVSAPRRPVTRSMRAIAVEAEVRRLLGPHSEGLVDAKESERLIREQPNADSLPPFSSVFVSPDKTLWIVDAIAPGDTSWSATAFRADGAIVGRLRVSGSTIPVAFGNDRVVVRSEDADGIVSLAVRRITVARAPRAGSRPGPPGSFRGAGWAVLAPVRRAAREVGAPVRRVARRGARPPDVLTS